MRRLAISLASAPGHPQTTDGWSPGHRQTSPADAPVPRDGGRPFSVRTQDASQPHPSPRWFDRTRRTGGTLNSIAASRSPSCGRTARSPSIDSLSRAAPRVRGVSRPGRIVRVADPDPPRARRLRHRVARHPGQPRRRSSASGRASASTSRFVAQYRDWLAAAVRLDFGYSMQYDRPVRDLDSGARGEHRDPLADRAGLSRPRSACRSASSPAAGAAVS